jgi:hypothetical protein
MPIAEATARQSALCFGSGNNMIVPVLVLVLVVRNCTAIRALADAAVRHDMPFNVLSLSCTPFAPYC